MGPAIEADAQGVGLQHPIHAIGGRLQPVIAIVVGDALPTAGSVVHQIGRIGEDEIHAVGGQCVHQCHAIAMKDGAARRARWRASACYKRGHCWPPALADLSVMARMTMRPARGMAAQVIEKPKPSLLGHAAPISRQLDDAPLLVTT